MKGKIFFLVVVASSLLFSCRKEKVEDTGTPWVQHQNDSIEYLKINQIQVVGSHNSYRTKTYQPLYDFVIPFYDAGFLPANLNPAGWDYSHVPLPEQFGAFGMRGIEIDVYEDAQGGRFYNRGGLSLIGENVESGIPELLQPGFKVLHIPDFDYNTNYYTFVSALQAVKAWSDKNPNHIPIFINIESKTETVGDAVSLPALQHSIPYTAASAEALEAEIRSVFGQNLDKVITPDQIRGSYATLREAVLAGNWPTLGEARGKILFAMEGDLVSYYLNGHPSLQGRAMFTYADPQADEAAFVILNNPSQDMAEIQQAVMQGFIVRTRADSDTEQARTGDYSEMEAAFSSGAQIISTDYYQPDYRSKTDPANWSSYHVAFPGNVTFRINPLSAADKEYLGPILE